MERKRVPISACPGGTCLPNFHVNGVLSDFSDGVLNCWSFGRTEQSAGLSGLVGVAVQGGLFVGWPRLRFRQVVGCCSIDVVKVSSLRTGHEVMNPSPQWPSGDTILAPIAISARANIVYVAIGFAIDRWKISRIDLPFYFDFGSR